MKIIIAVFLIFITGCQTVQPARDDSEAKNRLRTQMDSFMERCRNNQ